MLLFPTALSESPYSLRVPGIDSNEPVARTRRVSAKTLQRTAAVTPGVGIDYPVEKDVAR